MSTSQMAYWFTIATPYVMRYTTTTISQSFILFHVVSGKPLKLNNMTPKEKAEELVDKFYNAQIECLNKIGITELEEVEQRIAKQSALIAVDEVLGDCACYALTYWQQVKTEIESL